MKRFGWYALLGVLCVGLGAFWFFQTFEHKPVPVFSASRGEASYNRFLALQETLRRLGVAATSADSLAQPLPVLHPGDLMVLGDDVSRIDAVQAAQLAAWVRAGGHLLFEPPQALSRDTPLLDALGVLQPRAGKLGCLDSHTMQPLAINASALAPVWCARRFHLGRVTTEGALGDASNGWLFARVPLGRGTVAILADLQPMSFEGLRSTAAQRLVWHVLGPDLNQGQVYLVYQLDGPSLLRLLVMHGWPALFALALLLVAWMAMRSQRLGPPVPLPPGRRRALLEHVQAVGEFLFRRDGGVSLHRLACQATVARVARRDPFGAQLHGEPLYAWLAERGGLEPARVARAFQPPANAAAFRASLAILARL